MKLLPVHFTLLLGASLVLSNCNSKHDTDAHEQEAHAGPSKPAPVAAPPSLRDTLMQVHHQSGVALTQAELAFGKNAELKDAARRIVRDEQAEIKQYQRWLKSHPTN